MPIPCQASMVAVVLSRFMHSHRAALFAIWLAHVFMFHYFVLGFISWDGFGHRGFPLIELAQHGRLGSGKYDEWSLAGYTPFVELAHLPFLEVFGLKGLIIGFPLVVFPLCVWAVHAFVEELTGDDIAATYGALGYAALPMINQQPFSGYIDFAVSGLLAFFLFALLRLRTESGRRVYLRLAFATMLFTLSRVQAVYVAIVVVPGLIFVMFGARAGRRIRVTEPRKVMIAIGAMVAGAVPAIGLQVWRLVEFGSPTFPVQFRMLGITIGDGGFTRDHYFQLAGLDGDGLRSVARGFFEGWIWHGGWPIGGFYASRYLAAGALMVLALVLLPVVARRLTRLEVWLLGGFAVAALLARDFAVPRWGYTLVIALVLVLGRAMSRLSASRRGQLVFWPALLILLGHLARPEVDYLQFKAGPVSPRMNITGSGLYLKGSYEVPVYPDLAARFVILDVTANHFVTNVFGPRLTNEVMGTAPGFLVGPHCELLTTWIHRGALFIDDQNLTSGCRRTCALTIEGYCRAWAIQPIGEASPPTLPH